MSSCLSFTSIDFRRLDTKIENRNSLVRVKKGKRQKKNYTKCKNRQINKAKKKLRWKLIKVCWLVVLV